MARKVAKSADRNRDNGYNLRSKAKRLKTEDKNNAIEDDLLFETVDTQNCDYLKPIDTSTASQLVKTVTKMPNKCYHLRQRKVLIGEPSGLYSRREAKSMTISDLPDDCLLLIFEKMDSIIDKCRIQSVNKRFSFLVSRLLLAQKMFTVEATFGPNPKQTHALTKQMCNSVIQKCPNLQRFKMPGFYTRETHQGQNKVGDKEMHMLATKCRDLRELDICGCGKVSETGIKHVIENCSRLEKLSLSFCHDVDTNCLKNVSSNFRTLSLNLNDQTAPLTKILQNLSQGEGRHLKELNVCTYSTLESQEAVVQSVTSFSELEVLRYSVMSKVYCKYTLFANLHNLKHLAFDCNSYSLDDLTLIEILKGCGQRLKTLFIRYEVKKAQKPLSDLSLRRISSLCPNLEKIHLHSKGLVNPMVTADTIQTFGSLKNLEHLDLRAFPSIGDSVIEIIRLCPKVKNLFLVDCHSVTNATFNAFIELAKQQTHKKFRFSFAGTQVRSRRKKVPNNMIDCSDKP